MNTGTPSSPNRTDQRRRTRNSLKDNNSKKSPKERGKKLQKTNFEKEKSLNNGNKSDKSNADNIQAPPAISALIPPSPIGTMASIFQQKKIHRRTIKKKIRPITQEEFEADNGRVTNESNHFFKQVMNKPHQSINVGNPPTRDQIIQILVGIIKLAKPDTN